MVLDTSFFHAPYFDINATSDKTNRAYSAKLSAISLNFNSLTVRGERSQSKCEYFLDPVDSGYIRIQSANNSHQKPRAKFLKSGTGFELYSLKGCKGTGYTAVQNPPMYFGHTFKRFIQMQGIQFSGKVVLGKLDSSAQLLYEHKSRKLSHLIHSLNTFSNNFMSEMLLLHLGAKTKGASSGYQTSVALLNAFGKSISPKGFKLYNASGLSAKNRLSCDFVSKLLTRLASKPLLFSSLYLSLARPNVMGTMEGRTKLSNILLSAKTGTLMSPFSASGLAGYVKTSRGKELAFCILVNKHKNLTNALNFQDNLIKKIVSRY